jgi:hypothetical protein
VGAFDHVLDRTRKVLEDPSELMDGSPSLVVVTGLKIDRRAAIVKEDLRGLLGRQWMTAGYRGASGGVW